MDYGIRTRYFRFVLLLAALVAVDLFMSSRSFAWEWYQFAFNEKYQAYDTALDTCKLCHPNYPFSYSGNSFASDYADPSIGNHTFNGILEAADSDIDGFTNIQEINQRTFPGDPTSHPSPSAVEISLVPADGTTGVPVTAVVTATGSGFTDISPLVNGETFSLTVVVAASSPSMEGAEDPACVSGGMVIGSIDYNDARTEATFTPLCNLAHSTTYEATVIPPASALQSVLAEPVTTTFQTVAWSPDSDGDGVGDEEDDIPDDNGKATPPSPRMTGKFLVEAYGNAGYALRNAEGISDMYPQFNRNGRPFGFHFPDGLVRYALEGVPPGGSVTVAVTFPSGCPAGSKVFKVDSGGFREAADAVVDGNRVVVTLTDGGIGDADGVVNGEIVDPIGLAVPEASGDGSIDSSSPGTGGGCAMMGNGGGGKQFAGSIGLVLIALLGFALLGRKSGRGR